jgi:hypothetical protein
MKIICSALNLQSITSHVQIYTNQRYFLGLTHHSGDMHDVMVAGDKPDAVTHVPISLSPNKC